MIITFIMALAAWLFTQIRPGVNTTSSETPPSRTAPTDTGRAYVVVVAERGPNEPYECRSFEDYKRTFGARLPQTSRYWDAIEAGYKYGLGKLTIIRARAAGVIAHADLLAGAAISLTATALGQGTWYNGLNVAVQDDGSGNRRVVVTHDTDTSVNETSPYAADQATLAEWSKKSRYIRLSIGAAATVPDVAVNVPLAGGTDDYATITSVERLAALATIDPDLGPGQVVIPGATTAAEWDGILSHTETYRRDAILDYPDTADEATLTTLADTARGRGRFGAGFAGWLREPGPGGLPKTVAPSVAVAARIAAWDAASGGLGQNKPVAGSRRGTFERCLGVSQSWPDSDVRTRLNAAGVNLIREMFGGVMIYGWRSLAEESAEPGWRNFGHRRLQTALEAKIDSLLGEYLFEEIDGERTLFKEVQGSIVSRILDPYFREGSLYGASAPEAYRVDVDSVNTPETIQDQQLNVAVTVVESEYAEEINVNITKNLITQGVGA